MGWILALIALWLIYRFLTKDESDKPRAVGRQISIKEQPQSQPMKETQRQEKPQKDNKPREVQYEILAQEWAENPAEFYRMWMGKTFLVKGTVKEIAHDVASLKLLGEVKQLEGNYVVIGDSRGVEMMFYYPHDLSNISDFLDLEAGDNVAIEGILIPNDDVSVKKLVFAKCSIKQKPREARKPRAVDYESLAKEWKDNPLKFIHQSTAKTFIVRGTIYEFAENVDFIEDGAKRLNGNFIVFCDLSGVRMYFYFSDSSSNLFDFKKGDRVDVKGIFYRRTVPSANELLFVQCSIVQP